MACNPCGDTDPVDYAGAATAQGAANREAALASGRINNPNIVGPYGSVTYSETDGSDRPTQTTRLSDDQAEILRRKQMIENQVLEALGAPNAMNHFRTAIGSPYMLGGAEGPQSDFNPNYTPDEYYQTEAGISAAPQLYSDLDFSWAAPMPEANENVRNQVTKALFDRGSRLLDQRFVPQEQRLRTNLTNQGIFGGSEAWNDALNGLAQERQTAYGDLGERSVAGGGEEMRRLFDMGMQARQQSVGEIAQQGSFRNSARSQMINELLAAMSSKNSAIGQAFTTAQAQQHMSNAARAQSLQELISSRTLPINVMTALLHGQQVNLPQYQLPTPINITPPPLYQATKDLGDANQASANAQANTFGNLAKIAGTAAMFMSDRRLKDDIHKVGETKGGLPLYHYLLGGQRQFGVMAQDAQKKFPEAVLRGPDGYLRVDYSKIQ